MFAALCLFLQINHAIAWPWQKHIAPEQIHIALAGGDATSAPTGVRVAWFTHDLPSAPSTVNFGTAPGELNDSVSAPETISPVQYIKGHGYHHMVPLIDLLPSTTYYYKVGSGADHWSAEWSFKTAPAPASRDEVQFSMSIFGDIGYLDSDQRRMTLHDISGLEKKWSATVSRNRLEALKAGLDLVWIVGDISYADDAFAHGPIVGLQYETTYNGFMNWFENVSATIPLMVSPGNHESECHGSCLVLGEQREELRNFSAYNTRWHMPSAESTVKGNHNMWYSYNYGPVHFVSVNTETDWHGAEEEFEGDSHMIHTKWLNRTFLPAGSFGQPGEYLKWLEKDLKAAAEARASGDGPRWIVAGGHRPYGDSSSEHLKLFEKYGVDMYFAGHSHSYSRSAPVNGVTYVVVGGAGCEEMDASYMDDADGLKEHVCVPQGAERACEPGFNAPEGSEVFATSRMAIGKLDANASMLHWRLYDSVDGEVLDEVVLAAPAAATRAALSV